MPFLTSCGTERVIEEPVGVEVVRVEYVAVPSDLLLMRQPTTIPESVTYGEALLLWSEDRATIGALLGQLEGIGVLNDGVNGDN